MNEQDQKRIHLQAWQDYQAALLSFVGHKQKIEDMRDVLASASTGYGRASNTPWKRI
jgi:pyruvate kinase